MFKKVLFVLLFSCLLTGCFNFKSKDAESFKTIVEKKGFKVHNVTKQYETDLINLAYVAYNEKSDYQIEFLSFKEIEAAKNSFQRNRAVFQSEEIGRAHV